MYLQCITVRLLKVRDQTISSELERLTAEIAKLRNENDSLRSQAAIAIQSQENNSKTIEYREQSVKFKTLMEEKDKLLQEEKEKNEWMNKEVQRVKNELFALQLENTKNSKELFNCTMQLKEAQNAVELEIERRKRIEEDKEHYAKMVEITQNEAEEQSLLSAIRELCLIILSKVFCCVRVAKGRHYVTQNEGAGQGDISG
eukprot:TRINITY_DN7675_c0_g2_i1.p1 TRINITY_DN7675_c0_g2~~TRINITY_DN7675_c0_g2_i1.p1  ORF type:complete len:201 (+),score=56.44 TRINITY_DN7675_c0_g2_i1:518-1120(+)